MGLHAAVNLADTVLALAAAVACRALALGRGHRGRPRRAFRYGADLYALAVKGNLNHLTHLLNPCGVFERVYVACFDPRSLTLPPPAPWLKPVLLSRWRWRRVIQIARLCRRERIGLFRCLGPNEAALAGLCLKIALGRLPIVLSTGGDHRLSQDLRGAYAFGCRRLSFLIERLIYRRADLIFCINACTRRLIARLGGPTDRLVLNPIRIDTTLFDPSRADGPAVRRRLGLPDDDKVVLFVGRLERDKLADLVFDAMPRVLRAHPDARLVVVGDGSQRADLERRAREGGFADRVRFEGFQDNEALAGFYAAADVVCIPVSGFVVFEAAAMARPIVALDVDWQAEFVEDGVTGRLVPERDPDRLADGIAGLLSAPSEAARLGRGARQRFLERYEPGTLERREADLLEGFFAGLDGAAGARPSDGRETSAAEGGPPA